ncbi:MAG: PKD domain-containing protein [Bacteroidales bacterium]|nr:PKD domain-containing protein [Bacteroidales bacterium]
MKPFVKYLLGLLALLSCSQRQDDPVSFVAPQIRIDANFKDSSIKLGESLTFGVELLCGSRVSLCWYVDDVLEATGTTLNYTFGKPGEHIVNFVARNGAGEYSHKCTVTVSNALSVSLTYEDGSVVEMYMHSLLNCVATVATQGVDVSHSWYVDGVLVCNTAFLKDFPLEQQRIYKVRYQAQSELGSLTKEFSVNVVRIPLEVSFSVSPGEVTIDRRTTLNIIATPLYDGIVASQSWRLSGKPFSTEKDFSLYMENEGFYTIEYEALNPDGFSFTAEWDVFVTVPARPTILLTDFEEASSLPACFLSSGSTVLEVVGNPAPSSVNPSAKCMRDKVDSEGSTSGYFTFSYTGAVSMGVTVSDYTGIRLKIYLGKNKYLPLIEFKSVRYAPIETPSYSGDWETLEYDFGQKINSYATFRPMLDLSGNNVGARTETNNKIVYFDDIELF